MEIELIDVKNDFLKSINLKIKENEITSFIGKNKSGKTLILDMIYGLNLNYSGKIIINKKLVTKENLINIRNDIFYLIDDVDKLLFNINIKEDIKYAVKKVDDEKLKELFNLFNLNLNILDKNYLEISTSEKKKISLIMAFLSNKKILLLDNPTSYLDYKSRQNLIKILKRNKKNQIIIISSMDTNFLLNISDKVIALNDKKIIQYNNKYEIFENKTLLNKIGVKQPDICDLKNKIKSKVNINLPHSDNINDLLKDVYRNVR